MTMYYTAGSSFLPGLIFGADSDNPGMKSGYTKKAEKVLIKKVSEMIKNIPANSMIKFGKC
jgi:hypothetical protein